MTATISAVFQDEHSARGAMATLRAHGYHVTLGHQQPAAPVSGICPGSGRPAHWHMDNAVLLPSRAHTVLTVLVTNDTARAASDVIRTCGGKTFH